MRIKKKNVARLASLSALGAGALGVAAGTAQAGIVNVSLPSNPKVGFSSGSTFSAKVNILSGTYFGLLTRHNTHSIGSGTGTDWRHFNNLWGFNLLFKLGQAVSGQTWKNLHGHGYPSMSLGLRRTNLYHGHVQGPGKITHTTTNPDNGYKYYQRQYYASTSIPTTHSHHSHSGTDGNFYKLFLFNGGSGNLYGWAYFYQTVDDRTGPDVDILGVAYDDSGAFIAAGDTGNSGVPEPSTMALTGLAALALGATGLRRWRAARKPAA
ncbi:MAG: PEP-CTERM sorting domain-containing protein [Bryobacteraceae bacterium]|jgi:hypothetical protein